MALEEAVELYAALNPVVYRRRSGEWIRGGLPGSSMRDGSPSSDTPNVGLDGADVGFLLARAEYARNWNGAVALLAEASVTAGKPQDRLVRRAVNLLERCRVLESALPPLHPRYGGDDAIYRKWHREMARKNAEEKVIPSADCVECGKSVDNIGENRIKTGRCPACYKAHWRAREKSG